ncbi:MAG: shikimate kinase [Planctomycetia bacterium]|nr:shikimate kinase [Planctomycetia bacterium]
MPRITLIGYRGCGKSTVAALLARRLGIPWRDADAVLEERVGLSIATIVKDRGEPAFRDLEAELLAGLLAGDPCVLATGGGVVLRSGNRELLQQRGRPVVWLTAPADVVRARLAADPTTAARRPGLSGADPLAEVASTLVAREPLYRACADAVFDSARQPPEQLAEDIVSWLQRWDVAERSGTAAPESFA